MEGGGGGNEAGPKGTVAAGNDSGVSFVTECGGGCQVSRVIGGDPALPERVYNRGSPLLLLFPSL